MAARLRALPLIFVLLSCACAGPLGRAQHAFDEGRYPDAAAELRRIESQAQSFSPKKRARYALTRGLTHLACGDTRQALRWLQEARSIAKEDPKLFDASERGRLAAAWRSMGLMPAEDAPPEGAPPEGAPPESAPP